MEVGCLSGPRMVGLVRDSHDRGRIDFEWRSGAMLVFVALLLVIFIIMAVFCIDVAYMQLARTELRAATDAAARAGGEALSRKQDPNAAVQSAIRAARRNTVASEPLTLTKADIQLGRSVASDSGRWLFRPNAEPFNSIQVRAEKSKKTAAGPVKLLLGKIVGVESVELIQVATASQVDRDVCLVMDRSGSMAWDLSSREWSYPPDIPPYPAAYCTPPHPSLSRWAAAANAVSIFLDELNETITDEHVALVSYSSPYESCDRSYQVSQVDKDLTSKYQRVNRAMNRIARNPICGGTSISAGIDEGRRVLTGSRARPLAEKTMIVLTDGQHNYGRSPVLAAQDAAAESITVYTITFSAQADQRQMQQVAVAASGEHYHAPTSEALREVFRTIARTLPVVLTD